MALTVKQLNADASFLLTFEPITDDEAKGRLRPQHPFVILLDPWLKGPSSTRFSSTTNLNAPCVSSLHQLPEPDLVIITRDKSDHCNRATLCQLPKTGTKTIILAEPSAAKVIRGWRHFDKDKVRTLRPWQDSRKTGQDWVTRINVMPNMPSCATPGLVTVSLIQGRRSLRGQQSAIGITYRPPTFQSLESYYETNSSLAKNPRHVFRHSFLSTASTISLPNSPPTSPIPSYGLHSNRSTASLSPHTRRRTLSVIFSPHGISYSNIEPYVTRHLLTEAALPLTALLHCFHEISIPWWWWPGTSGGGVSAGMPTGQEIASVLGARVWISAHDGDKHVKGLGGKILRKRKYELEEVQEGFNWVVQAGSPRRLRNATEILAIGTGEEVTLTSEGIWEPERREVGGSEPLVRFSTRNRTPIESSLRLELPSSDLPLTQRLSGLLMTDEGVVG